MRPSATSGASLVAAALSGLLQLGGVEEASGRLGIIDTLSAGFGVVNRRLPLIVLPILLDLFLWLGPRLSVAPFVARLLGEYERLLASGGALFARQGQLTPDQVTQTAAYLREFGESAGSANLFKLLAWQLPSLGPAELSPAVAGVVGVSGLAWLLPALIGLGVGGLLLSACYLEGIARAVRDEPFGLYSFLAGVWRSFGRMCGLLLLGAAVVVLVGVPLTIVIALVGLVSPELAGLIVLMVWSAALVMALLLYFVADAVFVGGAGPFSAIRQSLDLFRRHFWPAFRFVGISLLILYGTWIAWRPLFGIPGGVAVAIVGNAYVASGIAAASMIFYRDRYRAPVGSGQ